MTVQEPAARAASTSQKYHAMFPDIPSISSQQLIDDTLQSISANAEPVASVGSFSRNWKVDGHKALLVDVRSSPEQSVSMISGAISLHEFKTEVLPNLTDKDEIATVVLYCTIGYRSGMEGQRLSREYPSLFQPDACEKGETNLLGERKTKLQLRNMDGIINFANVLSEVSSEHSTADVNTLLINPKTKQPATRVHVYGSSWKYCLDKKYEPVVFSNIEFSWRGLCVLLPGIRCPDCLSCCT